jgi:hypothetical protein
LNQGAALRIFKTKAFARFARSERIPDRSLAEAVERARSGLVDADLGGGVIKQRIARQGQGRSGGYRVLMAYRQGIRCVFLYGFAKSERANIDDDELATARDVAKGWLEASPEKIAKAIERGLIQEVKNGGEEEEA